MVELAGIGLKVAVLAMQMYKTTTLDFELSPCCREGAVLHEVDHPFPDTLVPCSKRLDTAACLT
jgi:hypothetical protein